jgi:hypothetical protein
VEAGIKNVRIFACKINVARGINDMDIRCPRKGLLQRRYLFFADVCFVEDGKYPID